MIKSTIFFVLIVSINFQVNSNTIHSDPEASIFTEEKMLGIDSNYVSIMKNSIFRWRYGFTPIDIYSFFNSKGVNYLRLRIFVKETGPDSLSYATNTAKIVQNLGIKCSITLFLSSGWSDIGKQPAPEQWNNMIGLI